MLSRRNFLKVLIGVGINVFALTLTNWPINIIKKFSFIDKWGEVPNKSPKAIFSIDKKLVFNPIDDVKALAGVGMQGRESGSSGEGKAAEYISNRLRNLGLSPIGESGYEQVFIIPPVEKTIINGRVVFIRGDKNGLRLRLVLTF